jgi:2,3-bisphosphoglycerate-dependent phosphoglycerate mutase
MQMASLTLIRHGQSTYNVANLFTGNVDAPLTTQGEAEALAAGEKIKNISYQAAYTSMLVRARETLRIILEDIRQTTIPIYKSAALNERMYGNLQGLNKAETAAKYGDAQVEVWRRSFDVRPPGGESLEDTYNRAVPYYKSAIEKKLKAGNNVLIVAHGNSLRALMMYLENISKEAIVTVEIATGIPRIYNFNSELTLSNVTSL